MSSSATEPGAPALGVIGQVYPWDLVDGAERAAGWRRLGIRDVAIALYYHAVRAVRWNTDGTPEVVTQEASASYVPVDEGVWSGHPLAPARPSRYPDSGLEAIEVARGAGLAPRAWLALTHRDGGDASAERYAVVDAWGNRSAHGLCPSYPEVRSLGTSLLHQVHAATGITDFLLESVASHGIGHLVAHDKVPFAWVGDGWNDALSLCFCPGCEKAGEPLGYDVAALAARIRTGVLADPDGPGPSSEIAEARRLRRTLADAFLVELEAVVEPFGGRITVAATTDERAYGPNAPVTLDGRSPVTACTHLGPDDPQGWADVRAWSDRGVRSIAGVLDMLPPHGGLPDALAATSAGEPPLHLLDDLYLYHLGLRRPDTLGDLRIAEVVDRHRAAKGQQ